MPSENVPVLVAMFAAQRSAIADVLGPDAPKPGAMPNPLSTADDCVVEMSAAFGDVEVHRVAHVQPNASVDAFWESTTRSAAPLLMLRKNVGEERWTRIADRTLAALRASLGSGPLAPAMPAVLTVGTAR